MVPLERISIYDRLPSRSTLCMIYKLRRDKHTGEKILMANTQLAMYDHYHRVWRFVDSGEVVEEDENEKVIEYSEVFSLFTENGSRVIDKGKWWYRLKCFFQNGCRFEKNESTEEYLIKSFFK